MPGQQCRILLTLLLWLLCSLAAAAHQDTRLDVLADGSMPGLPEQHRDARLTILFDAASALKTLKFKSSGRETQVPHCALHEIRSQTSSHVMAFGSWYHDERIMPHYVAARFKYPEHLDEKLAHYGVDYIFSLRTSELFAVWIARPGEGTINMQRFDPDKLNQGRSCLSPS